MSWHLTIVTPSIQLIDVSFTLTAGMPGILQACQAHVMPVHPMCHGDSPATADATILLPLQASYKIRISQCERYVEITEKESRYPNPDHKNGSAHGVRVIL